MTIKEPKQQIKKTGMDELLSKPQNAAPAAPADMTQQVAEAIKQAGQKTNEEKLQTVRESTEKTAKQLREEADAFQAGESAVMQQPEDGLQRMIQEAKLQTDTLGQESAMIGADPALQGAGQKLRQVAAGLPAADVEEQEWVDTSYLMPQSELKARGQKLEGDDFALTGRVYRPNADGSVPQWLSVGDQVVTAGGTYVITGHDMERGGYQSRLLDANQTTDSYQGNYNTGTYGSMLGDRNEFNDSFRGNRDSAGEYTGYGGYSINQQTGKMQFDTVAFTFDGKRSRAAVVDGVAYVKDAQGNLSPMEPGSLIQDASERYWVIGADGAPIDVTPEDPMNNPLKDPTGVVGRIQMEEAKKAGLNLNRSNQDENGGSGLDPAVQAEIDRMRLQLERQQSETEAANRDLYRQYRLGQERLEDQLVGAGLNTSGVSEKAQARLTADYLSGMNANQQQMRDVEDDTAYQIQRAKLLALQEAEAERQAEAEQKAATLARYGDFSGYSELGYTPAEVGSMQQAYAKENAPDTGYKGLSDYAQTLLSLYQANPGYDIKRGLQQALDGGLISQQDYIAALQTAAGMAV